MALFQKSVEKKYLNELDRELINKKYIDFQAFFGVPAIQENIRIAKEEQFQEGFLRELFVNILGYTLNPQPDFNLTTELKNISDSKKTDGAILKGNEAIAVIELKSTATTDLGSVEAQAFNYKSHHPHCIYVITSNFEKLRFYIHNAVEYIEFDLFNLTIADFDLLWLCIAKDNLLTDLPLKIQNSSLLQEEDITKKLYEDYAKFREAVFQNLVSNNPDIDKLILFKKTQKLIDRFLFILFAEDRLLLPPNSISEIIQQWRTLKDELDEYFPLYERSKKYFGYINTGHKGKKYDIYPYNGGLFTPDDVLDSVEIDDDILFERTRRLSQYDFDTEVDVNILGHIFEHSLNEIENVQAEILGEKIDSRKTKRKKEGIYYTPKYITKYIVENTIGRLCREKRDELDIVDEDYAKGRINRKIQMIKMLDNKLTAYRNWLLSITILDPACGSGAFLNQALEFLIREHKKIDELRTQLLGGDLVFPDITNDILEKNIYGVDLNDESVEIAKLSLWLRTAAKGRKLKDLSKNIKCGNSLIDDPAVAGTKAFIWQDEFPEIFANGGFDVVIGNPPYVDIKALPKEKVAYLTKTYYTANNRINLFSIFIERACNFLRKQGRFSFIVPSSLLTQDSYKLLRNELLRKSQINGIVRLPNESFGGTSGEVKVDTIIITLTINPKITLPIEIIIYKGFDRINDITSYECDELQYIDQAVWLNDENYLFRINVNDRIDNIIKKIETDSVKLESCAYFSLGLTPYDKYKGHSPEQINSRVFHSDHKKDETYKKLLAGNDVKRYYINWNGIEWISYGDWLGASREEKFFKDKRILVKQIIDWTDKRIWASLTTEELYNTQNAFNLIAKEPYLTEYLLLIINSNLISFYHRKKFLEEYKDRFQKILIKDCKEFPIKMISQLEQLPFAQKANMMISLQNQLYDFSDSFQRSILRRFQMDKLTAKLQAWYHLTFTEFIQELKKKEIKMTLKQEAEWEAYFLQEATKAIEIKNAIEKTDKEIDRMVYNLYGLTEEEIKIVEGLS
ncbi:MAG: N-6 DNA methylase [Bacteroidales bacterium]|nr:N-6 DNA methylase [Bacteroidales bacterium]